MATSAELRRFRLRNSTWMGGGGIIGPILQTLTSSVSSATVGVALNATISGKTAGSVLSLTGAGAAGVTASGNTVSGTPTTVGDINVVETLAGATGSPKTTSALISVTAAAATVPAAMAGPTLTAGDGQITVARAAAPSNGGSAITSYDARRSTDGTNWTTITGTGTSQALTGLVNGTAYQVQTRAVNAVGAGAWSPSATATPVAAAANALMPLGTTLINVGPSIDNVVNMRAPRNWVELFSDGFFYTGPGTNQSVGGAGMIANGASVTDNYWGAREAWTDAQIPLPATGKKALIRFNDIINSVGAPIADLKAEVDRRIAKYLGAGSSYTNVWLAFSCCMKIGSAATDTARDATRIALNDYLVSKKGTHPRLAILDSCLSIIDPAGKSYDGLHPTGNLAMEQGKADALDLVPFRAAGKITYGATAPAANLEADWRFEGSAGTLGVGASGTVVTGFTVNLSTSAIATSGQAAGSTVGMTANCTTGVDADGNPAQIIEVVGTPTADWFLSVTNPVAYLSQPGGFSEAWVKEACTGSGQANPAGIHGRGIALGTLGMHMNKAIDVNAGILTTAWAGVGRTVPVAGLVNNQGSSQLFEYAFSGKSGVAVNFRLVLSQMGVQRCETEAYNVLFNLSAAYPGTSQNPLHTARPAISGTKTVGQTGTLQVATVAGGNATWTGFDVIDVSNSAVLTTRAPGGAAMTYVFQAADSGKTVGLRMVGSNDNGPITVPPGLTYAVNP